MSDRKFRPGEAALPFDPAEADKDAGIVYIGRIRSPWATRAECPRNMIKARERAESATVLVDDPYRPALKGLETFSHVIVLYWLDKARRDLMVQNPAHAKGPKGTFSLRSPVRPNPIGLAVVGLKSVDIENGVIEIDAIDCLDNTPLIDLKPYMPTIDAMSNANTGWHE